MLFKLAGAARAARSEGLKNNNAQVALCPSHENDKIDVPQRYIKKIDKNNQFSDAEIASLDESQQGAKSRVYSIELGGSKYIAKIPSVGASTFKKSHEIARHSGLDIFCMPVLLGDHCVVMERLIPLRRYINGLASKSLSERTKEFYRLAGEITGLYRSLKDNDLTHNDFGIDNIVVKDKKLLLIDLDDLAKGCISNPPNSFTFIEKSITDKEPDAYGCAFSIIKLFLSVFGGVPVEANGKILECHVKKELEILNCLLAKWADLCARVNSEAVSSEEKLKLADALRADLKNKLDVFFAGLNSMSPHLSSKELALVRFIKALYDKAVERNSDDLDNYLKSDEYLKLIEHGSPDVLTENTSLANSPIVGAFPRVRSDLGGEGEEPPRKIRRLPSL